VNLERRFRRICGTADHLHRDATRSDGGQATQDLRAFAATERDVVAGSHPQDERDLSGLGSLHRHGIPCQRRPIDEKSLHLRFSVQPQGPPITLRLPFHR
jgi:hypothetical protein